MLPPPPRSRLSKLGRCDAAAGRSPRAVRRSPPVELTAAQVNARRAVTPKSQFVDSSSRTAAGRSCSPCTPVARWGGENVRVDDLRLAEAHEEAPPGTRYDSVALSEQEEVEDELLIPPSSLPPATPVAGRGSLATPPAVSPLFSPTVLSPAWPAFTPTPAKLNRRVAEDSSEPRSPLSPSEASVIGSLIPTQCVANGPLGPQPRVEPALDQPGRSSLIAARRRWRAAQTEEPEASSDARLKFATQSEICRSCLSNWREWAFVRVLGRQALESTKRNLQSIRLRSHLQRWLRRAQLRHKTREIVAIRFVLKLNARRRCQVWEAWVAQVERRRETEELRLELTARFDTHTLKQTWRTWLQAATDIRQCYNSAVHVAEVFCSMQRTSKIFAAWQNFLHSERRERDTLREARQNELRADMSTLAASIAIMEQRQLAVAIAHLEQNFRARQLNCCMHHWHVYTSLCSRNRRLVQEMTRRLHLRVVGNVFVALNQYMQDVKMLAARSDTMAATKALALQQSCLKAWIMWMGQRQHKHRRDAFAAAVRNSTLARQCCAVWLAVVVRRRGITQALETHRGKWVRAHCASHFEFWQQYCQASKLIGVRTSRLLANICSRQRKANLQAWRAVTTAAAVLRRRAGRFHGMQSLRIMTAAFHRWEMFRSDSNATLHLQMWAIRRLCKRKLKQIVVQWCELHRTSQHMCTISQIIGSRASSLMARRALLGWRYTATAQRDQSRLTAQVARVLARNRLRHILRAVHALARSSQRLHVLLQQCARRARRTAKICAFREWLHVCQIHALAHKAACRVRQRLCVTVLQHWSHYAVDSLHARARADALVARQCAYWSSRRLAAVWYTWTMLAKAASCEGENVRVPIEQDMSALESALAKKARLKDLLRTPEVAHPLGHVSSPVATVQAWERVIAESEKTQTSTQTLALLPMLLAWSDWTRARGHRRRVLHDATSHNKRQTLRCFLSSWHEQTNWLRTRQTALKRAKAARLHMKSELDRVNEAMGDLKLALQEKCIEEECLRQQVQLASPQAENAMAQTTSLPVESDLAHQERANLIQRLVLQGAELQTHQKAKDQQADTFREWVGLVLTKKQNAQLIAEVRNRHCWTLRRLVWHWWSFLYRQKRRLLRFTTHKLTRRLSLILNVWRVIVGASWRTRAALSAATMEHTALCSAFDRKITSAVTNTKTRQLHIRHAQMQRRLNMIRLRAWLHSWQCTVREKSAWQRVTLRLFHRRCGRIRCHVFQQWNEHHRRARSERAVVERAIKTKELTILSTTLRAWFDYSTSQVQFRSFALRLHCGSRKRVARTVVQGAWNTWLLLLVHRRLFKTQQAEMQALEHAARTVNIQVRQRSASAMYRRSVVSLLRNSFVMWRSTCLHSRGLASVRFEPFARQLSKSRARRTVVRIFWHWRDCRRYIQMSEMQSRYKRLHTLTMASVCAASRSGMRMVWSAWRGACVATVSRSSIIVEWSKWGGKVSQRTRVLTLTGAVLRGWSAVVILRHRRITVEEMALKLRVRQAVRSAFASWQLSHEASQCAQMKYQIVNSRVAIESLIAQASSARDNVAHCAQTRLCRRNAHRCLSRWRALVARKTASAFVYRLGVGSRVALSQSFMIWRLQVRPQAAAAETQTSFSSAIGHSAVSTQTMATVARADIGCETVQKSLVSAATQSAPEPVKEVKSEPVAETNTEPKAKLAVDETHTMEQSMARPLDVVPSSSIAAEVAAIAAAVVSATESVLQQADAPADQSPVQDQSASADASEDSLIGEPSDARSHCEQRRVRAAVTTGSVAKDRSGRGRIADIGDKADPEATKHAAVGESRLASYDGPFGRWARSRTESTTVKTPTSSTTTSRTYYGTADGFGRERQSDRPLKSDSICFYDTQGLRRQSLVQPFPTRHEIQRHTRTESHTETHRGAQSHTFMSQEQRMDLAAAAADQAAAEAEASLEALRRLAY